MRPAGPLAVGTRFYVLCTVRFHSQGVIFSVRTGIVLTIRFTLGFSAVPGNRESSNTCPDW